MAGAAIVTVSYDAPAEVGAGDLVDVEVPAEGDDGVGGDWVFDGS